jgi:arylsulfatase A-like enzyme
MGIFSIPILYFHPNDLKLRGSSEDITQQLDIKPTILDYLHYPKKFVSLGNSIFSHLQEHFAVMKLQNQYQYIDDNFLIDLGGNGEMLSAYKVKDDNLLLNNLSGSRTVNFDKVQCKLKAIIKKSFR